MAKYWCRTGKLKFTGLILSTLVLLAKISTAQELQQKQYLQLCVKIERTVIQTFCSDAKNVEEKIGSPQNVAKAFAAPISDVDGDNALELDGEMKNFFSITKYLHFYL